MDEHVFPSEEDRRDAVATELAADLLERLLDRISRPNHDWTMIAREAAELAELATQMAADSRAATDRAERPARRNQPATSADDH